METKLRVEAKLSEACDECVDGEGDRYTRELARKRSPPGARVLENMTLARGGQWALRHRAAIVVSFRTRSFARMPLEGLQVNVDQGALKGVLVNNVEGGQHVAFRGIPYAKPPVGHLRFQDPEPAEKWVGSRDASQFGGVCAQMDLVMREIIGSDDCLYLNVYSKIGAEKRPVMVWIHGGAFNCGSGNDNIYGPDYLIEKDVVLVTINYRLGVLGFLNLEDEVASGNQGMKDQVLALKWVRENISAFGGDPGNVTIFGESAGAFSVHLLALSPLATGLFHKAICQSGVALSAWGCATLSQRPIGLRVAKYLGLDSQDSKTVVEFLRKQDAHTLVEAQKRICTPQENVSIFLPFVPSADPHSPVPFLPEHPWLTKRFEVNVPLLLGYNSHEGLFFTRDRGAKVYKMIDESFEVVLQTELRERLKAEGITAADLRRIYFGDERITPNSMGQYAALIGDMFFTRDVHRVAENQAQNSSSPTFLYKLSYDNDRSILKKVLGITAPGATHTDDLFYLFYPHAIEMINETMPEPGTEPYRVMQYFTEMWTNFAKTGDPTPRKTDLIPVVWEPVRKGELYNYMHITDRLQMETARKGEQRFEWNRLKNKL